MVLLNPTVFEIFTENCVCSTLLSGVQSSGGATDQNEKRWFHAIHVGLHAHQVSWNSVHGGPHNKLIYVTIHQLACRWPETVFCEYLENRRA